MNNSELEQILSSSFEEAVNSILQNSKQEPADSSDPLSLALESFRMEDLISLVLQQLSLLQQALPVSFSDVNSPEYLDDCAICLDPLHSASSLKTFCNHTFHMHCILKHLRTSSSSEFEERLCPLCRCVVDEGFLLVGAHGFDTGCWPYGGKELAIDADLEATLRHVTNRQIAAFRVCTEITNLCMTADEEGDAIEVDMLALAVDTLKRRQREAFEGVTERLRRLVVKETNRR